MQSALSKTHTDALYKHNTDLDIKNVDMHTQIQMKNLQSCAK